MPNLHKPQSPSVSSDFSLSNNALVRTYSLLTRYLNTDISQLSSKRTSLIPQHIRNTLISSNDIAPPHTAWDRTYPPSTTDDHPPLSAPISHSHSWRAPSHHSRAGSRNFSHPERFNRSSSRLSEPVNGNDEDDEEEDGSYDDTIRNALPIVPYSAPVMRTASIMPMHAIATPAPTLLFAIASDDLDQVKRVLESGEAGPNDQVGPQSALAFTLTNDKLKNKKEIVKALLAFGADPSALNNPELNPPQRSATPGLDGREGEGSAPPSTLLEGMDPAMRYYVARADAPSTRRTSQLIHRSFFRPLTRVRYDLIGQDCALEQLFRVLSMHSQQLAVAPIVVLLCGNIHINYF